MSPRTTTLPPTEPAMWKRLLKLAHPDTGGDHELFIWCDHLREMVCASSYDRGSRSYATGTQQTGGDAHATARERVPFSWGRSTSKLERCVREQDRLPWHLVLLVQNVGAA
jgi:hypothetical protein